PLPPPPPRPRGGPLRSKLGRSPPTGGRDGPAGRVSTIGPPAAGAGRGAGAGVALPPTGRGTTGPLGVTGPAGRGEITGRGAGAGAGAPGALAGLRTTSMGGFLGRSFT